MSARVMWRAAVVTAGLTALTVVGVATAQAPMNADSAIEARKKLMKDQGAAWKNIQDNAKTGNWAVVAANAEIISKNAAKIPSLFPEGSLTDKSKAKPDIWQKWPEFQAAAKNLENRSATLRDQAMAKDGAAVTATVANFGRDACGACHTPFRVPPPQQQPAQPRS